MIPPDLLRMLVCPASRQPVREATAAEVAAANAAIAGGRVLNRGGTAVTTPLQAALATADGAWLYPIQDDIPIMLSAEAIATWPADSTPRAGSALPKGGAGQ